MGKKLFELFSIKNNFANHFAKCWNLLKHSVLPIMVILLNNTFLYYRTNQISMCCIILQNAYINEWLIVSSFFYFVVFSYVKIDVNKIFVL